MLPSFHMAIQEPVLFLLSHQKHPLHWDISLCFRNHPDFDPQSFNSCTRSTSFFQVPLQCEWGNSTAGSAQSIWACSWNTNQVWCCFWWEEFPSCWLQRQLALQWQRSMKQENATLLCLLIWKSFENGMSFKLEFQIIVRLKPNWHEMWTMCFHLFLCLLFAPKLKMKTCEQKLSIFWTVFFDDAPHHIKCISWHDVTSLDIFDFFES